MIEHMVVFRFRDDVDGSERDQLLDELRRFPEQFPAMIEFRLGENRSNRDDRFTHAFTVRFEGWQPLNDYLASESHERFVTERFRPLIAERVIVSFECES